MIRRPPRSTLFPYTRSSDLPARFEKIGGGLVAEAPAAEVAADPEDRKSTRLNSSHANISYAVFCLKKKKKKNKKNTRKRETLVHNSPTWLRATPWKQQVVEE